MSGYHSYFRPSYLLASAIPNVRMEDMAEDVTSVTYESEVRALDKLTLTLRNDNFKYRNDERFRHGIRFLFRFGYPGKLSRTRKMVVTGIQPTYGSGINSIVLTAFPATATETARRTGPRNWGPLSSSDIAVKVARMFGLNPLVEPSRDGRKSDRIQPASMSFYEYLNKLADEIGFDFYVDENKLIFQPMELGSPDGKYTFYGTGFTLLKGFSPSVNAAKPPATRHAGAAAHGSGAESSRSGPRDETASGDGPQGRFMIAFEDLTTRVVPGEITGQARNEVTRPTAERAAHVRARQAQAEHTKIEMSAVQAGADFVGDPFLLARKVIAIRGVDREYEGAWRITRATHSLSESYTTTVQMSKLGKNRGAAGNRRAGAADSTARPGTASESGTESGARDRQMTIRYDNLQTQVVQQMGARGAG